MPEDRRFKRLKGTAADLVRQAIGVIAAAHPVAQGQAETLRQLRIYLDQVQSWVLTDPEAALQALREARVLAADIRGDLHQVDASLLQVDGLLRQVLPHTSRDALGPLEYD